MDAEKPPYVVVGGGPAAAAAVRVLATAGAPVLLIGSEHRPPYDRTYLSKQCLLDPSIEPPALWHETETWLADVTLRLNRTAVRINRAARTVTLDDGTVLPYCRLLLATGAQPRRLDLPGIDGAGVHLVRERSDLDDLRATLRGSGTVVVIGGGLIGLEVAASARTRGCDVDVVEAAPRLLGRSVPQPVAERVARLHQERGVRLHLGVAPAAVLRGARGEVTAVRLGDGRELPAHAVVVGVGAVPRDALARDAGLTVDDGILVDAAARTADPAVFAAGDAARTRRPGQHGSGTRQESYQSAERQGRTAALAMLQPDCPDVGAEEPGRDGWVPWSWSDQYDVTLQTTGTLLETADHLLIEDDDAALVLSLDRGVLIAACGIAPGSAIARAVKTAQQAIDRRATLVPAEWRDVTDMRTAATRLRAAIRAST